MKIFPRNEKWSGAGGRRGGDDLMVLIFFKIKEMY